MKIIKDIDLIKDVYNYDVILVGTSIMNALGNGFQKKVALNFPIVNSINKSTKYGDKRKLGVVKVINTTPIFCLCYISKGRASGSKQLEFIDYEALIHCLKGVAENFKDKKIATTVMGACRWDGYGNKDKIIALFEHIFKDVDITLYDYEQKDYRLEDNEIYKEIVQNYKEGKIDKEEYQKRMKNYKEKRKIGELNITA